MTDKEKIREQANIELSNLRVAQEQGIITWFGEGKLEALEGIVDFIDSLQEEPVSSMWHDASEEPIPNMELICIGQYGNPLVLSSNSDSFKSRDISKWAYFNDLLNLSNVQRTVKDQKEESVSEDLEKAAVEWFNSVKYKSDLSGTPKSGAKWQKEKDSILPKVWNRENLDYFSYQTAYDLSNDWMKETPTWDDVEMACKLGAKWQAEQFEKERLKQCGELTPEQAQIESDFVIQHLKKNIRHRTAAVTKWEYCEKTYSNRVLRTEFEKGLIAYSFPIFNDRILNDMGLKGWEVINVNQNERTTRVLFKRLKSD